jgi:hypothetical protein
MVRDFEVRDDENKSARLCKKRPPDQENKD